MTAINWNNPTITSNVRTEVLQELNAKAESLAKQLDGDTHTNLPTGAIKRVDSGGKWEFQQWSGTAWSALVPKVSTALKITSNLSDLNSVSTARANLGLGALATLSTISNSNWSGTALSVANGGTGATSASDARWNLGLGTAHNVEVWDCYVNGSFGFKNTNFAESGDFLRIAPGTSYMEGRSVSQVRSDISAAASGANTDITSLTGCTLLDSNGYDLNRIS